MISKWKLANFKAIAKETELDFAPLTILAGANSSGKSTLLQSVLLISQTLAHRKSHTAVLLNGNLVRLGHYQDLRTKHSPTEDIRIGWTISRPSKDHVAKPRLNGKRKRPNSGNRKISSEVIINAPANQSHNSASQVRPLVVYSKLEIAEDPRSSKSNPFTWISAAREPHQFNHHQNLSSDVFDDDPELFSQNTAIYTAQVSPLLEKKIAEQFPSSRVTTCILDHLIPTSVQIQYDRNAELLHGVTDLLRAFELTHEYTGRARVPEEGIHVVLKEPFPDEIVRPLLQLLSPFVDMLEKDLSIDTAKNLHPHLRRLLEARLPLSPFELPPKIDVRQIKKDLNKLATKWPVDPCVYNISVPSYRHASHDTVTYFAEHLKYLGPIRDQPKSQYPLTASYDPEDVGVRGERTASVLEEFGDSLIRYIHPANAVPTKPDAGFSTDKLIVATTQWLEYMDIAGRVETEDKGRFGHEIRIGSLSNPTSMQDLVHVGVGVSQLIPIVVMCLIAPKGSTLVLEQPELHLHPKTQAALADFFLSIERSGKQCIIETHSEHLINRIRRRVAAGQTSGSVKDLLALYFTKNTNGESTFQRVEINEYGAITEWPEGFFDQSQLEAASILGASLKKRRDRRKISKLSNPGQ